MVLSAILFLSRLLMFVERLWVAFTPLFIWLGGFIVTAGFGLWLALPVTVHLVLLGGFVLGGIALFVKCVRHLPDYPALDEARRALERQKRLIHRPLSLLSDKPATVLSPEQQKLWDAARTDSATRTRVLPRLPETVHHKADCWGVRYPMLLGLVLLMFTDGAPVHLGQTLFPVAKLSGMGRILGVEVWLEPPSYTERPGFALEQGQNAQVLSGTVARAQIHVRHPLFVTPILKTNLKNMAMPAVSGGYTVSTTLQEATSLRMTYGWTTLFDAEVRVDADKPPLINFSETLAKTAEGLLDVAYAAADDYGVKAAWLVAEREGVQVSQSLIISAKDNTEIADTAYVDFTSEMIAGLPAQLYLEVEDVAGQRGQSDRLNVILPERTFYHPVALKLVELRRELVSDPKQAFAIMGALDMILSNPTAFGDDTRAYMSMTMARQALLYREDDPERVVSRAAGLMWDAAIRIEKGPVSQQLDEVMQAQKALQKGLAEGATPDELKALFAKFQQAMSDLFQSMSFGNGENTQGLPDVPGLRDGDVADLMKKIAELMASGAYDQAREALKKLEDLMANVQFANDPRANQVMETLKELGDLANQQKQLIDDSFKNQVPGKLTLEQQLRQKELREKTQKLAQKLAEMGIPPGQLGKAIHAMRQVMENANKPGGESYVNHLMNQAFESLEQAREGMVQQLLQQAGYGNMMGMKRDPSGKLHQGTEDVPVPEDAPETLSRKIRDELFNRADDLGRSDREQDYLRRLLDRF